MFLGENSGAKKVAPKDGKKQKTRPKVAPVLDGLLSVGEAAKQLGVKTKTLRKWCLKGKLPAVPIHYGSKTTYRIHPQVLGLLQNEKTEDNIHYPKHSPCKVQVDEASDHASVIPAWQKCMERGLMTGKPFSPSTVSYYRSYVEKFLLKHRKLNAATLKKELLDIPAEQFGRKDKFYKAMVCFGKYLIQEKILVKAFLDEVKPLRPKRHKPPKRTSVDEAGLTRLLEACDTPLEKALVMLLSSTGLRASECANLMIEDVDLENQVLLVRLAKGGKTRRLGLSSSVANIISDYLESRTKTRCKTLFLNSKNEPIDRHGIRQRMERLGRLAGVSVSPHALRRAFVTINANKGRPLQMLQIACGHSSIKTTRDYCQTSEEEVIEAMRDW